MTLRIIICVAAIAILGITTYFLISSFLIEANISADEFTRGDV
jgi:hypothetical protein